MIFLGDFLRECWYAGAVRHITKKFELQFHYIIIATSSTQQNWSCLYEIIITTGANLCTQQWNEHTCWSRCLKQFKFFCLLARLFQLAQILFLNQLFFSPHILHTHICRMIAPTFRQYIFTVCGMSYARFFLSFFHSVFYYSITTIL